MRSVQVVSTLERYAFMIAFAIYSLYFSVLLVSAILFSMGFPISRANGVVGVFMAMAYCACARRWYYDGCRMRHFLALVILVALIVCSALYIAGRFYDISYDGMCFHQEGIISLYGGWNPFRDDILQQQFPNVKHMAIVLNCYAKAPWILAAAVYKVTGSIEHGKAINLLLIGASGLLAFSALRTMPAK